MPVAIIIATLHISELVIHYLYIKCYVQLTEQMFQTYYAIFVYFLLNHV